MHDQSKSSIARAIAWVLCTLLFYAGDAVSRIVYVFEWSADVLMPVYSWLMLISITINDEYGLQVWTNCDASDDY